MLLLNAFSLNMVATPCKVGIVGLTVDEARAALTENGFTSAVGHADTAAVFSSVLGVDVAFNRATVSLQSGDAVVVGQYKGPRLEEGTTALPQGAVIDFLLVTVV